MTQRANVGKAAPEALRAVYGLEQYVQSAVDGTVLELIKLRASVLNGCAFCIDMHTRDALAAGESSQRLFSVAAWHDTTWFTPAERAALALTDAVTKISGHGVPDAVWNEVTAYWSDKEVADLIVAISTINVWNRLNIATRHSPEPAEHRR